MKQQRLTILLGLVFVVLAFLVLGPALNMPATSTAVPSAETVRYVYDWPAEQILALVVDVRGVAPMELQREAGVWFSPATQALVDQQAAEGVARTLAQLPILSQLDEVPPERYAEFGLSRESLQMFIQVVRTDGTPHALVVGDRAPDQRSYYVLVDDRPQIYQVLRDPLEFLAFAARDAEQRANR
ncbi:MAG: DUF4340 domain-containing protein [Anaerolineae bacterium]|nr:DUF4340 domain-containing protein [Anaerolineae bacterium]MDW8173104.1 DUF4340 domain-containing protein [Anaerolineae bacterium]